MFIIIYALLELFELEFQCVLLESRYDSVKICFRKKITMERNIFHGTSNRAKRPTSSIFDNRMIHRDTKL